MRLPQVWPASNPTSGLDGIRGKVLQVCAHQLKGVLTELFQLLLHISTVPKSWKSLNLVSIPKKSGATEVNGFM